MTLYSKFGISEFQNVFELKFSKNLEKILKKSGMTIALATNMQINTNIAKSKSKLEYSYGTTLLLDRLHV
jgi:hypothetical protein